MMQAHHHQAPYTLEMLGAYGGGGYAAKDEPRDDLFESVGYMALLNLPVFHCFCHKTLQQVKVNESSSSSSEAFLFESREPGFFFFQRTQHGSRSNNTS
nr:unnamed protein product [Digitaria exilis]